MPLSGIPTTLSAAEEASPARRDLFTHLYPDWTRDYAQGLNSREIAEKYRAATGRRIHPNTVLRALKSLGVDTSRGRKAQAKETHDELHDRLLGRVNKEPGHGPSGDCWQWQGASSAGYGMISVPDENGAWRPVQVHRVAHELFVGPIPDGQVVRHLCGNRLCCRPDHLAVGTYLENVMDAVLDGSVPRTLPREAVWQARLAYFVEKSSTIQELADRYGVSHHTMSNMLYRDHGFVPDPREVPPDFVFDPSLFYRRTDEGIWVGYFRAPDGTWTPSEPLRQAA